MNVAITDPMSGNDVTDIGNAPFIVESSAHEALKIYFDSKQNKQGYIVFVQEDDQSACIGIYNSVADNETIGTIN